MVKTGFWILSLAAAVGLVVLLSFDADPEATLADEDLANKFRDVQTSIGNGGNFDGACKAELGSNWQLADFSDIVEFHDDGGSIPDLVDSLRWNLDYGEPEFTPGRHYLAVSRNGDLTYGSRQYFVQRHDHNPPGNFLVHAHINGHHISLGSWHSDGWTALCYSEAPPPPTPTPTPEPELLPPQKQALVDFYNATNGDRWRKNDNWLSDKPLGTWHGIKTDGQGNVVEIKLPSNNLSGTIPCCLRWAGLDDVAVLDLSNNKLAGAIPPGNLLPFGLVKLDLSGNQLTGGLPDLYDHWGLKELDISNNRLSGGISAVKPFRSGLPTTLRKLNLHSNSFTGQLPDSLSLLHWLVELRVSHNNFTGCIPTALQGIKTNDFNDLKIPYCKTGDSAVLESLYQHTGGEKWTFPWPIKDDLDKWVGVTTTEHGRVTHLLLGGRRLSGEIPPQIGDLSELEWLDLSRNSLTGQLPKSMGNLDRLERLTIINNNLSGCVPQSLRKVKVTDVLFTSLPYCGDVTPSDRTFMDDMFIEWHIDESVPFMERRAVLLGAQWLHEFAMANLWRVSKDKVTVYVDDSAQDLVDTCEQAWPGLEALKRWIKPCERLRTNRGLAIASTNFVRTHKGTDKPLDAPKQFYNAANTAIHELIHARFQYQLGGLRVITSPDWFIEGMATYFAAVIEDENLPGWSRLPKYRERWIDCATKAGNDVLVRAETFSDSDSEECNDHDFKCEYHCGALAIELLESKVGSAAIDNFYIKLGEWISLIPTKLKFARTALAAWEGNTKPFWQQPFKVAFGMTVKEFYDLYECHKGNGFDLGKLNTCE